jgi:serine/threonine protein kinase
MNYVHAWRMVHRDLNPEKVLIDEGGKGLICDLGLSRVVSPDGKISFSPGTAPYAAPEQLKPTAEGCNEKVYVFSFGWVAWAILKRVPRYNTHRRSELGDPSSGFDSLMTQVIYECLSEVPSERPSFFGIFNQFKAADWNILPGVDTEQIKAAVQEVIRLEMVWRSQ